jgi:hypothetical protein
LNTNLAVIPSRGRPDNVARAVAALKEHSKISDICVAIDDDEADLYPRIDGVIYEVNPRLRMNGTLNLVANKYADNYKTIYFLGDDHMVRTTGWDELLYAPIKERSYGLAYGDDKFQGENLATAVMMSTNIIKILGFMSPPVLIHLYMDNFWMTMGHALDAINYVPAAVIEHMHYLNGKAEQDQGYIDVNSSEVYTADRAAFEQYAINHQKDDVIKVAAALI